MTEKITSFRGTYSWLSNFYATPVNYNGVTYKNAEAAFQAAKCADPEERKMFANMNPVDAKKTGRRIKMRADWDKTKINIMREIVFDKFSRNPSLAQKLIATDSTELIEGNKWHDTFWGVDNQTGNGLNWLGKILMETRERLQKQA